MITVLIVLLVASLIVLGFMVRELRKRNATIAFVMEQFTNAEETKKSDVKYYNRSMNEMRKENSTQRRFIQDLETHHKKIEKDLEARHIRVVNDLNRQRQTLVDAYEHVLETHTLFPNYKPSHLSAA